MRLLVIALAVLAAAWVVANVFLFILPFVLGLFGIIFIIGVVKSTLIKIGTTAAFNGPQATGSGRDRNPAE